MIFRCLGSHSGGGPFWLGFCHPPAYQNAIVNIVSGQFGLPSGRSGRLMSPPARWNLSGKRGSSRSRMASGPSAQAAFSSAQRRQDTAPSARSSQPSSVIVSRLVQVRHVSRAAYADDGPFPLSPGMRVGVLPIGRADGLPSIGAGHVLIGGRPARILRIWTEHTAVDLTDLPSAAPGHEAVLFGAQGGSTITIGDIAAVNPGTSTTVDLGVSLRNSVPRSFHAANRRCGLSATTG
jgi:Alanine racemase, C-terminal domain